MLTLFRRRAFALLTVPTVLSACHRYVPVTGALPEGARVSIDLTDRGTVELARFVGPGVGALEGQIVRMDDSVVTIGVKTARQRNGIESYWAGEQVPIDRDYIATVEERQISRPRTAVAAAGFTLLLSALAVAFTGGFSGGSAGGDGGTGGGR
jgi:hypothetical protein